MLYNLGMLYTIMCLHSAPTSLYYAVVHGGEPCEGCVCGVNLCSLDTPCQHRCVCVDLMVCPTGPWGQAERAEEDDQGLLPS